MCGRVRLSSDVSEIKLVFSIPPHRPTPNFPPGWNVAPTDQLPIVRFDARASERSLDLARCGLVPYWAKDIKVGFANINAKAEGIESKPAFREGFQRRRCLVPVDNFYEWKKNRDGEAILCPRACRLRADGAGRALGELALASRRMGAQFRNNHYNAQRAVRRASQPDARGPRPRDVATVAGRRPRRCAAVEGDARALPFGGNDVLARECARGQCEEQ